jgi:hypothetical protein
MELLSLNFTPDRNPSRKLASIPSRHTLDLSSITKVCAFLESLRCSFAQSATKHASNALSGHITTSTIDSVSIAPMECPHSLYGTFFAQIYVKNVLFFYCFFFYCLVNVDCCRSCGRLEALGASLVQMEHFSTTPRSLAKNAQMVQFTTVRN